MHRATFKLPFIVAFIGMLLLAVVCCIEARTIDLQRHTINSLFVILFNEGTTHNGR